MIPVQGAIATAVAHDGSADIEETAAALDDLEITDLNTSPSTAVDGGLLAVAGLVDEGKDSGQQPKAQRKGSRRAAAAKKQTPEDPDMPSVKTALAREDADKWKQAMKEEYKDLRDHGTFTVFALPAGKKAISAKFVLKLKRGPSNEIDRYKARYVARGFTQIEGVDFFETYSPVGCYATLRVLLAIAAREGLMVRHVDIQCAYLNVDLSRDRRGDLCRTTSLLQRWHQQCQEIA